MFTGSFDGSLRVWDASEIQPEKVVKTKEKEEEQVNPLEQSISIENEMRVTRQVSDYSNPNRQYDEHQFIGSKQPTRVEVQQYNKNNQYY